MPLWTSFSSCICALDTQLAHLALSIQLRPESLGYGAGCCASDVPLWVGSMCTYSALCWLIQDCITVPHVSSTDSSAVLVRLQARGSGVPSDNTLTAVATYASSSGEPCTTSTKANPHILSCDMHSQCEPCTNACFA